MAVVGKIKRPITGQQFIRRLMKVTVKWPTADVQISATSTASVQIPIACDIDREPVEVGIESIQLPSGSAAVYIVSFSIDKANKVINMELYNPSSGSTIIPKDSFTAVLLVEA